jgi:tetratricopeptide (TPR) repeat protein
MGQSIMRLPSGLTAAVRGIGAWAGRVAQAMDRTYQVAIRAIVVIVGVVLVGATAVALYDKGVVIEPISVPPRLVEDGYSGAVVSRLLFEQVQVIREAADNLADHSGSSDERAATAKFFNEDQFAALAAIQGPSSILSLRSLVTMLRDFLKIPERKVSGAITIRRPEGKPVLYKVALVLSPPVGLPAKPEEHADVEEAIRLSARWIARQHDPVGLAAYYFDQRDLPAVKRLADDLMGAADWKERRAGLFIRGLYEERLAEKIALLREVIAQDPTFIAGYNALGRALVSAKKTDEGIEKYGQAIRLMPDSSVAFRNRAVAYRDSGRYQLAVEDFEQASRLKATAEIFFDLAYAYEYLQDFGPALAVKAIKAYDEALRLRQDDSWALNNRCYLKALRGDGAAALADCDRALQLRQSYQTYDSRGFAYLRLGRFDDAIKDYDKALKIEVQAYSLFGRGLARRANGERDRGDADIEEALRLDPDIEKKMRKFGVTR